ncbi:hypothetical protein KDA_76710 [Dictyobacter alpinus]|uniref:Uncharacterized protein n=1 Tax=Dictyobacter alpinus TaxID=2014873 RepID=A0A402BLF6_9CHLR|nr:hypothetical protein KDA_76710 [Dictyobacter alpinus]
MIGFKKNLLFVQIIHKGDNVMKKRVRKYRRRPQLRTWHDVVIFVVIWLMTDTSSQHAAVTVFRSLMHLNLL